KAVGGEESVATLRTKTVAQPQIANLNDQELVVTWTQEDTDGLGIFAQRFDADGKDGAAFKVNTVTAKDQSQPAIAALDDGGFAVVWTSQDQDRSGKGVRLQMFDPDGQRSGGEVRVNTATAGDQLQPRAAAVSESRFVTVWTSAPGKVPAAIQGRSFDLVP